MKKRQNDTISRILGYALNLERTAKAFFQSSLERVQIPNALSAIGRLVDEETGHVAVITEAIERLGCSEPGCPEYIQQALKPIRYFDKQAQKEFLREIRENPVVPDVTVFRTAWHIEKDISEFYEKAATRAEGPTQKILQQLCAFEKYHERFFRKYHDELSRLYSRMYEKRPWA
ncbi:MAG: ferritin family protein [Thermodesulfobacteriota bacterium]